MQLSKNIIKSIQIMESIKLQNLVFHPISFKNKHSLFNLKSLDDLFDEKKIIVEEVSNIGSVPEVKITNNSDKYLVLIDGEAIKGAKQNRIILNSAIIDQKSKTIVPVNCVEKGRWQYKTNEFEKASFSLSPKIRNTKIEYLKNGCDSQEAIWNEIDQLAEKENKNFLTSDLGEILNEKSQYTEDFLTKIFNTKCNGFILQGIQNNFIELFYNRNICYQQITKNINGWMTEQELLNKEIQKPNLALNNFLFTEFQNYKNIGVEESFITCNEKNGKAILFNNSLIHGFFYF